MEGTPTFSEAYRWRFPKACTLWIERANGSNFGTRCFNEGCSACKERAALYPTSEDALMNYTETKVDKTTK